MKSTWPTVPFGDVVRLNTDRVADPAAADIERYVGIEHITPEDLRIRSWGLVAEGTTFTNHFRPGQVLFAKRRAYQRKVALADFEGVCSGDIYVLESKDPDVLLPELLPFICQTEGFFHHAVDTSAGSLSPRTNWSQLAAYEFPLPPPAEQRRIFEVLEVLLRVVDSYRVSLVKVTTLKQAVLKHQFSSDSTSRRLRLEDWCRNLITYGIVQAGPHVKGGIPYIRVSDMTSEKELSAKGMLCTSHHIAAKYQRSQVQAGDIVVALRGPVGLPRIVPLELDGANLTQGTARVSIKQEFVRDYVYWALQSSYVKRQYMRFAKGSTFSEISLGALRRIEIPARSANEQQTIASALNTLEHQSTQINARLDRSCEFFTQARSEILGP